jgi:hypothetical protein
MTFTDYICYIRALFGMWFEVDPNQLLAKLKENYANYYRNFIHLSLILFYTSLEIIFTIKTKLILIIGYFYQFF